TCVGWALCGMGRRRLRLTLMSRSFFSLHFIRHLKNKRERERESERGVAATRNGAPAMFSSTMMLPVYPSPWFLHRRCSWALLRSMHVNKEPAAEVDLFKKRVNKTDLKLEILMEKEADGEQESIEQLLQDLPASSDVGALMTSDDRTLTCLDGFA
ncbi:hypothetical protein HID58_002246, partial [Brassica napus]